MWFANVDLYSIMSHHKPYMFWNLSTLNTGGEIRYSNFLPDPHILNRGENEGSESEHIQCNALYWYPHPQVLDQKMNIGENWRFSSPSVFFLQNYSNDCEKLARHRLL